MRAAGIAHIINELYRAFVKSRGGIRKALETKCHIVILGAVSGLFHTVEAVVTLLYLRYDGAKLVELILIAVITAKANVLVEPKQTDDTVAEQLRADHCRNNGVCTAKIFLASYLKSNAEQNACRNDKEQGCPYTAQGPQRFAGDTGGTEREGLINIDKGLEFVLLGNGYEEKQKSRDGKNYLVRALLYIPKALVCKDEQEKAEYKAVARIEPVGL
jgi:hypothetical protein